MDGHAVGYATIGFCLSAKSAIIDFITIALSDVQLQSPSDYLLKKVHEKLCLHRNPSMKTEK